VQTAGYKKKCFDDIHINLDAVGRPLKQQTRFGLAILPTISFPSSIDAINGTFKNVHLRIVIDGCAADPTEGILFDNVALAETKAFYDKAYQDLAPAYINDSSACCPSDYCWDGKTCVAVVFGWATQHMVLYGIAYLIIRKIIGRIHTSIRQTSLRL